MELYFWQSYPYTLAFYQVSVSWGCFCRWLLSDSTSWWHPYFFGWTIPTTKAR